MNIEWLSRQSDRIAELVGWHILLSLVPLVVGVIVALPIGWLAHRSRRINPYVVGTAACSTRSRRWRCSSCSRRSSERRSSIR